MRKLLGLMRLKPRVKWCSLLCFIAYFVYTKLMAVNSQDCLIYDHCGRLGDGDADFVDIGYVESKSVYADYLQAAHGMIFSRTHKVLWDTFDVKGLVLMQMRFDGVLGFPGGLLEKGEDPVNGLNREMEEEIGLEVAMHGFRDSEHVMTTLNKKKKLVLHFFAKEVLEQEFLKIERKHLQSSEHGVEVMGAVRVPLFTMEDGTRGFPAFLANQFIGNARWQLLQGLQHVGLLTEHEIEAAVKSCEEHQTKTKKKQC